MNVLGYPGRDHRAPLCLGAASFELWASSNLDSSGILLAARSSWLGAELRWVNRLAQRQLAGR